VPTTAGTGSEVGRAGVLVNSKTHVKKIIFHPKILPSVVICDPELTTGMAKVITVGTGMDAFAHCLEAYCSPFYHPYSQGIALEGMRLVKENLPRVVTDPNDIEARTHMMSAASMGAIAFQKGLGAIHALSHPASALYGTHHGMTNAVLRAKIGVPDKLGTLGVDTARIDEMSGAAIEDPCAGGNPVELTIGAAKQLYQAAI
jgi:alcohol dehydrogenase class IV